LSLSGGIRGIGFASGLFGGFGLGRLCQLALSLLFGRLFGLPLFFLLSELLAFPFFLRE
jgi:hypothetical protein